MVNTDGEVDVAATLRSITKLKKHSGELDKEIEALMSNVRRLQFQKLQDEKQIKYYQGLITLARRMPAEILATIFELCVEDGFTRTPLTVSHVCSEWRRAAATPRVWSHIYVNLDSKDPAGRTLFWLLNARSTPLTVTVDIGNDASQLSTVMGLLVQRASQWTSFSLKSAFVIHANRALLRCESVAFTQLQEIDVVIGEETWAAPGEIFSQLLLRENFTKAEFLHTVRITRNTLPPPRSIPAAVKHLFICLQWSDVEVMSSIPELLNLVEEIPSLETLSVSTPRGQTIDFAPELATRSVIAPELSSLSLSGSQEMLDLLPHLLAPKLKTLTLRSNASASLDGHSTQAGAQLCSFLEIATPPLELLDVYDIDLSEDDLGACLGCLPKLQDLRLHECELTDTVLGLLGNEPARYCPRLHSLDLRWCSLITGTSLVDMVSKRVRTAPVQYLSVINCARVREADIVALAEYVVCRVMMRETGDYCRPIGCCQNDLYRRRLQRGQFIHAADPETRKRIIF